MKLKNFLVTGIVGGVVDFLLGWLFYGILFKDIYPQNMNVNLCFIFLGCMTFGLFVAYIFTRWAQITNAITGLKAGAVIGFFTSLYMNFFMYSNMEINYRNMIIDILISTLIGAGVGYAVALVNGKIK